MCNTPLMNLALCAHRQLLASVTLAEYLASQPPRTVISITTADPLSQVRCSRHMHGLQSLG